jgi:hypothetical protein
MLSALHSLPDLISHLINNYELRFPNPKPQTNMNKLPLLLTLIGILFSSCFKQEVPPVMKFDGEANMTIAELQQLHVLSDNKECTLIDTNVIITGIVISTDEFGSCYKELYIQDTTGGICFRIANTSYFHKYRIGQRIFVKAQDLYLGNYVSGTRYGFYQLGLYGNTNGGMEFISTNIENRHIFRSELPVPCPAPKIITGTTDIIEGIGGDYHTLVRLDNCFFIEADGSRKYFEPSGTLTTISQNVGFNNGTGTIQARISKFCKFANDTLPQGPLNITGILSMYYSPPYSPYQLLICDVKDVSPALPPKILESYDMKTNPFTQGWQNVQKMGTASWTYENSSVRVSPLSQETECWFVSPKFNFAGEEDVAITISYRLQSGTGDNLQALYTTNGADWQALTFTPQTGSTTESIIRLSNDIVTNPNLQIAFKYKTTTVFPMCAIYNVTLSAKSI